MVRVHVRLPKTMSELTVDPKVGQTKIKKELGLDVEIIEEGDKFIQVDLDDPKRWNSLEVQESLKMLFDFGFLNGNTLKTISKSGKIHVYLETCQPLDPATRYAISSVLGGDSKHVIFSLFKAKNTASKTVLYETPGEAPKVKDWLSKIGVQTVIPKEHLSVQKSKFGSDAPYEPPQKIAKP